MQIRPFFDTLMNTDYRLGEMDRQGIELEILSTWTDIFGYDLPSDKGALWHTAMNDSMARLCDSRADRFIWMASGALQDPASAARELERAMKTGAVGAIVATHVNGRNLGECDLDEYWAACVELNAPVLVHPAQPVPPARSERFALTQIVAYTNDTTLCVGSLISGGVMDRFPDLALILSHGGASVPFLIGRFDRMHGSRRPQRDRQRRQEKAVGVPDAILLRRHPPPWAGAELSARPGGAGPHVAWYRPALPPGDPDPLQTLRDAEFNADDIQTIAETTPKALFGI